MSLSYITWPKHAAASGQSAIVSKVIVLSLTVFELLDVDRDLEI